MAKHVYYKEQATGSAWHSVAKMEKQIQLVRRREIALRKTEQDRKDKVVIEYFNVKYPVLYQEAVKYYTCLSQQYPNIKDLRKTAGFKHFKATTTSTDTMVLKIPLVNAQEEAKKNETLAEGTNVEEINTFFPNTDTNAEETNVNINTILPDIDMNDLVPEIPQHIVDSIIQDLRADPDLEAIMTEVEDLVDPDIDVDIEIQDDILEKELQW